LPICPAGALRDGALSDLGENGIPACPGRKGPSGGALLFGGLFTGYTSIPCR